MEMIGRQRGSLNLSVDREMRAKGLVLGGERTIHCMPNVLDSLKSVDLLHKIYFIASFYR